MALLTARATNRRTEKHIGQATSISLPAITNLVAGTPTTNTINMPSCGVNDIVTISVQTPTNGVIVDAYVSAASVITIRQNNCTGSTIGTVAATIAQLQTLKR